MNDKDNLSRRPRPVPQDHPLRELFQRLVFKAFSDTLGLRRQDVCIYLAGLLAEFVHMDSVFRLRDRDGIRLTQVADMLREADVILNAGSFDDEREVHRHIGDFTLFWAGVYPDSVRRLRAPGCADHLIDYVRQGKQSYYIVSTFTHGRYQEDAPLFKELSAEFELCLYGLGLVRRDWERMASPGD